MNFNYVQALKLHIDMQNLDPRDARSQHEAHLKKLQVAEVVK
jgi:hypothetical protein